MATVKAPAKKTIKTLFKAPVVSSGSATVRAQQTALNARGANLRVDGISGPLTRAAIARYSTSPVSPQLNVARTNSQPTSNSTSNFSLTGRNLQNGSSGTNVSQLQTRLGGLTVDGRYGTNTRQAVMNFQRANGLTVDGIVGPLTTAALNRQGGIGTNTSTTPNEEQTTNQEIPYQEQPQDYQDTNPFEEQYAAALANTSGVDSAQQAIDDQNNAYRTGVHNVEEQPIGMSFISGQTASLENRNTDLQIPLQQRLANEQQKRQASLDSIKYSLDRADKTNATAYSRSQDTADRAYKTSQTAYSRTQDTADEAYRQKALAATIANNTADNARLSANANAPTATETKAQIEVSKKNDIASAVLNFRTLVQRNNWRGIDPTTYQGLVDIIQSKYGANAVLELEKAISDAGLVVDYEQTGY